MLTEILLALTMSTNPVGIAKDTRTHYPEKLPMPTNSKPVYNPVTSERSPVLRSKYFWEIVDLSGPVVDDSDQNSGKEGQGETLETKTEYNRKFGD
jgi:hypothetical protein